MEIPAPETLRATPARRVRLRRRDRGRLPYIIAGATLTMLLAMTLGTTVMIRTVVVNQSNDRFEAFAARASNTVAAEIRSEVTEADEVASLLVGSPEVTVDGFSDFARGLRERRLQADSIGFLPRVSSVELDRFSASIRDQGRPGFRVTAVPGQDDYYPVAFVDPPGTISAIGDDLSRDPVLKSAMEIAGDNGRAVASAPISTEQGLSFAVFSPIYRAGRRVQTVSERRAALLGFGVALYDAPKFLSGPFALAGLDGVSLTVTDLGTKKNPINGIPVYRSPEGVDSDGSHAVNRISVAGREWRIDFNSGPGFGLSALERNVWMIILGAGLAITLIATAASFSLATSSHSARSDLRLMSTQLSVFLDSALEGILLVDRDRRVVWTNQAFADAFGYRDTSELLGQTSPELERNAGVSVGDPAGLVSRIGEIYEVETLTVPAEDVVFVQPSSVTYSRTSVPVTDENGEYRGRLWVYRDVTGERAAEQAKGVFVSMVSHELRTPLTSVIGFLELVLSGAAGPITLESERLLGMARRSSDRLKRLVNDILDISRLEGGIRVDLAPVSLVPLVSELLDNVRREFESRNLTLRVDVPVGLPQVEADASRLFQVLMNLLTNAYRYTPEGGQVTLSALVKGDDLVISVSDTGIGIPEKERGRVFDRFVRLDAGQRKSPGSTGLGLAIAKSLTELQGGKIEVRSEVGAGTTFSVILSQVAPEASAGTPKRTATTV